MKTEAKALLTNRGILYAISRVAEYLEKKAETMPELEDKIIASGKGIEECYKYIEFKAKEFANGSTSLIFLPVSVMIDDQTVFDWAEHYYAENAACLEEMKPKVQPKPAIAEKAATAKKTKKKAAAATEKTATEGAPAPATDEVTPVSDDDVPAAPNESLSNNALSVEATSVEDSTDETAPVQSEETTETPDEDKPSEEPTPTPAAEPAEPSLSEQLGLDVESAVKQNPLDMPCAICGKPMREAFAQAPEEKIILWANSFMLNYGRCFCSKEHKEQWLASKEGK